MSFSQRYRIELGYDGTLFHGSQVQPGVRTVQGELEAAAAQITGRSVRMALAGRTDRGVHALRQVASGDLIWRSTPESLARSLQAVTPDDIAVQRVAVARDQFNARFSARSREYRYSIWEGPTQPLMSRGWVWHVRQELDLKAMQAAATAVLGEHDFAAFAGDGLGVPGKAPKRSTVRRIFEIDVDVITTPESESASDIRVIVVRIVANGFLPQMVRNIVGELVSAGRGMGCDVFRLLAEKDRRLAPAPAPAHGLTFWCVDYGEEDETAGHGEYGIQRSTEATTRR